MSAVQHVLVKMYMLALFGSISSKRLCMEESNILDHMLRLERRVSELSTEVASVKKMTARQLSEVREDVITNITAQIGTAGSVSFEARLRANPITVGNNEIFKFDEVTLNKGNAYNPRSGIFTVPLTGTYMFWANIVSADSGDFQARLYSDKNVLLKGYSSRRVTHGTASLMYITQVTKGQHIWFANFQVGAVTKLNGNIHSSYGGTLLTTV